MVIDAGVAPISRDAPRTTGTELVVAAADAPEIVRRDTTSVPLVAENIATVIGAALVAGLIIVALGFLALVAFGAFIAGCVKAGTRRGRSW